VRAVAWKRWLSSGRQELGTLSALLILAVLFLGFAVLASEMREGETRAFDDAILSWMRSPSDRSDPVGPYWFEQAVRDVTSLGSTVVLVLVCLGVTGFLVLAGTPRPSVLIVVSFAGGTILSEVLKNVFGRVRPDVVAHSEAVLRESFPSGHAALSAVTYLTLGALLAQAQPKRSLKAYLLGMAVFLTILVGVSRVYLGVHWPTDVLAGWSTGSAWAIACWVAAAWLQSRRNTSA
jgi:undecaprenyl-diphosphatase